jgi:hypothetical protein
MKIIKDTFSVTDSPSWVLEINSQNINSHNFDIKDILKNSLYYPAAGFDGDPIKNFYPYVNSFIYVDYSVTKESFFNKFKFQIIAKRSLTEQDLAPNGWQPNMSDIDGNPLKFESSISTPFCEWVIFKYGKKTLNLLYMCADGIATYQALYVQNNLYPTFLALIQTGVIHGNWTNFANPQGFLAKTIIGNNAGMPNYILHGGYYQLAGDRLFFKQPCWPNYEELIGQYVKNIFYYNSFYRGSVSIWKRTSDSKNINEFFLINEDILKNYLINNRKNPILRHWHNLYSRLTEGEKTHKVPNPLIFEYSKASSNLSKKIIFAWLLNWASRNGKDEFVKRYLSDLNDKDWES